MPCMLCASAGGGAHRTSASHFLRDAGTSCVRWDSVSGGAHCASASSVLRSTGSSRACRASAKGGAYCTSVSRFLRDVSSSLMRCTSAKGGIHRGSCFFVAPAPVFCTAPAPVVERIASAPVVENIAPHQHQTWPWRHSGRVHHASAYMTQLLVCAQHQRQSSC